jgi:hypothetical protein
MINNNRGAISIQPVVFDRTPEPSGPLTLENIVRDWNTLTHAVCQQSMSVGTYLQEGRPLKIEGRKLTIGFSHENEFHKEFLDQSSNLKIIIAAVLDVFKSDVAIELVLANGPEMNSPAAAANDALAMFGGEIVSEWDNGNGLSESH